MSELEAMQLIIKQIVDLVSPLKIIIFGSTGRGNAGPEGDLDILIVMRDGTHRRQTAQFLYKSVKRHGRSIDLVVVTESDILTHKDDFWHVICPAIHEGKVVYAA